MEIYNNSKHIRKFMGVVTSTAMRKTVVVRVDAMKIHPKYGKRYRVSKKYHVHDENGLAKPGDRVEFAEGRPLSKTKRWYIIGTAKKAD